MTTIALGDRPAVGIAEGESFERAHALTHDARRTCHGPGFARVDCQITIGFVAGAPASLFAELDGSGRAFLSPSSSSCPVYGPSVELLVGVRWAGELELVASPGVALFLHTLCGSDQELAIECIGAAENAWSGAVERAYDRVTRDPGRRRRAQNREAFGCTSARFHTAASRSWTRFASGDLRRTYACSSPRSAQPFSG